MEQCHVFGKYTLYSWNIHAIQTIKCLLEKVYYNNDFIVTREHKKEIEKMESDYTEKLDKTKKTEEQMANNIEELQKYVRELETEKETYKQNKKRLEAEMHQSSKSHEEEVQLRLKFESKLNGIYSVYRDLQNRVTICTVYTFLV